MPGIGTPSLTGMTQASAPAQAVATGRSRRRAYTRPAGLTTTTLRHSSQACYCQVRINMKMTTVFANIIPNVTMMVVTIVVTITLSGLCQPCVSLVSAPPEQSDLSIPRRSVGTARCCCTCCWLHLARLFTTAHRPTRNSSRLPPCVLKHVDLMPVSMAHPLLSCSPSL